MTVRCLSCDWKVGVEHLDAAEGPEQRHTSATGHRGFSYGR
jgi:hypothetical protein